MNQIRAGVLAIILVVLAACTPQINPPPIPAPIAYVIHEIFHSTIPDPTGVHAPREPHSCAIIVEPAEPTGHAPYSTVDAYWNANGWLFWQNCVITARTLNRTLPIVKIWQDPNETWQRPMLTFWLDSAPIFGRGSGHYDDPLNAANPGVWRKAYIEAFGTPL